MVEKMAKVSRLRIHVNKMRGRIRIAIQTWSDMSMSKANMNTWSQWTMEKKKAGCIETHQSSTGSTCLRFLAMKIM